MSSIFDYALREPEQRQKTVQPEIPSKKASSIFDEAASITEEPQAEEENFLVGTGRQGARALARASETILGAPRALGEFVGELIPEKAILKGAEKLGVKEGTEKALEFGKKYNPLKLLPTSQHVREFNETLFGKAVKPRNEFEKKSDEIVGDFTALAIPVSGQKLKLLKPALTALGGNLASEVVGKVGGSEKAQTYVKLGTFLAGSMVNPKGAENLKRDLFQKAKENLPENASVKSTGLSRNLEKLKSDLKKGGTAESKTKALSKIEEIEKSVKNGTIEVEELQKFKNSINESLAGLYDEFKTNKTGRAAAKANLQKVSRNVDDALKEYGKINPAWEAYYRPANEIHGAIAQSKNARNWLLRNRKSLGIPGALGLFFSGQALGPVGAASIAGAGAAGLLSTELASKIWRSPTLRKHYLNVVKAATQENIIVARENIRKLQEQLKESGD